jgi:general secretion pathway protein A
VYGRPVLAPWLRWLTLGGSLAGIALIGLVLWRAWPALEASPGAAVAAAGEPALQAVAQPASALREPLSATLAKDTDATTMDAAFGSLFALWNSTYQPGAGVACEQAVANGLSCVWQRGSLAQLKLINRPAILSLVDAQGSAHQVVLSELDDSVAKLLVGGTEARVPVAELADYWFGEFLVLWRPQNPALLRPLRAGMRGDDVRWLRQGLEQLAGVPDPQPGDFFDADLQRQVEEFQRSRRLAVDGVAGLQTQLVLDSALGMPGAPTLSQPPAQAGA